MQNSAITWQQRIAEALRREKAAVPGRAGETPISNLAAQLSRLRTLEERLAVVDAIQELVVTPETTLLVDDKKGYWRDISYLTKHLPQAEKVALQAVFREKLFDDDMRKEGLSVYALHGFIAARGLLFPDELRSLTEVKKEAPIAWLGAAVMSSLFAFARSNAIELLNKDQIDVTAFVMGMDAWREKWDPYEDFGQLVMNFREAVSSDSQKQVFTRWLVRRGYLEQDVNVNDLAKSKNNIAVAMRKVSSSPITWQVKVRA